MAHANDYYLYVYVRILWEVVIAPGRIRFSNGYICWMDYITLLDDDAYQIRCVVVWAIPQGTEA